MILGDDALDDRVERPETTEEFIEGLASTNGVTQAALEPTFGKYTAAGKPIFGGALPRNKRLIIKAVIAATHTI